MTADQSIALHHITQSGAGHQPMVFAHGFGCDQQMWRFVVPAFEATHRTIRFDHIGCGRSDLRAYDVKRHATLEGYADDVVALAEALDLRDMIFVGHSVSAMIGALASIRCPQRFSRLVMIGPSPRYLNDPPHYFGGFEREDIEGLSEMMERNLVGWAHHLSQVVIGAQPTSTYADELKASFCAADPQISRRFAAATFLGDNRADLAHVTVPALVIQVEHDSVAPMEVGRYCHEHLRGSTFTILPVTGHCPHLTHPAETVAAIKAYLGMGE
jgi:sigma-B regulation protein RsbQ